MKHPLPPQLLDEIRRTGGFRTLREELVYDYQSSLFRGPNRALLEISLTLHPRDRSYGGSVLFVQPDPDEALDRIAPLVARGLWEELARVRLVNFALVVHEMTGAISGDADELMVELGRRTLRHALHEAHLQSHQLDYGDAPERDDFPPPDQPIH